MDKCKERSDVEKRGMVKQIIECRKQHRLAVDTAIIQTLIKYDPIVKVISGVDGVKLKVVRYVGDDGTVSIYVGKPTEWCTDSVYVDRSILDLPKEVLAEMLDASKVKCFR